MKVLVVADEEDKAIYDYFRKDRVEGVELIISCGDLREDYLDFLLTMVNVPMVYIRGNHDDSFNDDPPLGPECIEGRVFKYKGLRFFGLGGCIKYRNGHLNQYTEAQMKRRMLLAKPKIAMAGGFDVFVTHSPAAGYGDMPDSYTHKGFECFNEFLEKYKPAYMFHGHVHSNYGVIKKENVHPSGTKIVNCCGYKIIDIPSPEDNK